MSALQTLLAAALETKWAILPRTLDAIISIIDRDSNAQFADFHRVRKDAYVGDLGTPVKNTSFTTINGNTGIITIDGPLVPRGGMMQSVSAPELASYEAISQEFMLLESDPRIKNILFVLDTPGGAVSGVSDLAKMIRASSKNTQGYVIGMAASAGYWLGSSVKQLYSSNIGEVGSIGVVAAMRDSREADKMNGVKTIEIVSSVSPNKRLDPATDAGRMAIQTVVDQLGEIFVSTVAENRKTSVENVLAKFGAGGMLVASSALEVGMIDGITTLQAIIQQNNKSATNSMSMSMSEDTMSQATQAPDSKILSAEEFQQHNPSAFAAILKQGADQERLRIQGIEAISHPDAATLVKEHKFNPESTKESVALAFVEQQSAKAAEQAAKPTALANAARDLAVSASEIPSGAAQTPAAGKEQDAAALATAIAAGGNR